MLQMMVSVDPLTDSNCYILYESAPADRATENCPADAGSAMAPADRATENCPADAGSAMEPAKKSCKKCPADAGLPEKRGGCIVIDPGESEGLFRILEEKCLEPELILLTHEHCDHMAGLDALRDRFPQARFPATAACDAGLRNTRLNMSRIMEVFLYFKGKPGVHYEPFTCRPADEIIPEDAVLVWRGHALRLVPLPGHTPGSEGIFLDEEVFFSGDYLLRGEETVLRLPGGSEEDYEAVTAPFLAALPKGLRVCPGHGEGFTV